MAKAMMQVVGVLTVLAIGGALTIYATARPYQQDRILIELGLKAR